MKKNYPNAFISGTYDKKIGSNDWNNGKRISVTHSDLNLVMLGNFLPTGTLSMKADFQKNGTWYDILTGQSITVTDTGMNIDLSGGEVKIFVDRK